MTWLGAPLSLVRHGALLRVLVRRDLQARYRGSVLGGLWSLAGPLLLIAVYTLFFSVFLRLRPSGANLADAGIFIMAGVLPWMALSEGIGRAVSVVVEQRVLVKKVAFPLELLPVTPVLAALVSQVIGLAVLAVVLWVWFGRSPLGLLLVPALLVPQVSLSLGLAWLLASLGVFVRDLAQAIGLALTGWMFLTPIFYPPSAVPAEWGWLLALNPMAHLVTAYRALLLGEPALDLGALSLASVACLLVAVLGGAWFMGTKHAFADVL